VAPNSSLMRRARLPSPRSRARATFLLHVPNTSVHCELRAKPIKTFSAAPGIAFASLAMNGSIQCLVFNSPLLLRARRFSPCSAMGAYIHAKAHARAGAAGEAAPSTNRFATRPAPIKPWSWADTWPVGAESRSRRLHASTIVLAGQQWAGPAGLRTGANVELTPERRAEPRGIAVLFRASRYAIFSFPAPTLRSADEIDITRSDGRRLSLPGRIPRKWVRFDASGNRPAERRDIGLVLSNLLGRSTRLTSGPERYLLHAHHDWARIP